MKRNSLSTQGAALIAVATVSLALICLIGLGLLANRQAWRENSSKLLSQAAAEQNMATGLNALKTSVLNQLTSTARVSLTTPPKVTARASYGRQGGTSPVYNYTSNSSLISLVAVQGSVPLTSLTAAGDPLYGLRATTTIFSYQQLATLTATSPLGIRSQRNQSLDAQVEIRQFPLSQFSQFHTANATISGSNLAALGRTHANGNLTFNTKAQTLYPLTVSGQLILTANASVTVKQTPSSKQSHSVTVSTSANTKRATISNLAVDQDVMQSTIATAATLPELVAPSSRDLGSSAKNAQKLSTQCDIRVHHDAASNTFTATTLANKPATSTQSSMALYSDYLIEKANGNPVIEFDLKRLETNGSRGNSYYLHSSNPNAILMIRNGGTLPRDLSIVTPHEVWIDAEFNTPENASQIKAASIITTGKVIGVDG